MSNSKSDGAGITYKMVPQTPHTRAKIELMAGCVRDEKRLSQTMHIVSGTAWVSMDGKDIVLQAGEELKLSRGKYDAVVSPTGDEPLVYECEE